ncbi:hypothetical protein MAR_013900 [Mya arenaria]|uniref:Gfo/Idh/MocA-like oxidoreductase C-terminal domain-containing protein n=1 Tax=Mya arenaria TaxID=6604 RepID=A0ABY7GAE5_MYAAR|nr:hypothetical protein MAR_013900 [Mya arenaria]
MEPWGNYRSSKLRPETRPNRRTSFLSPSVKVFGTGGMALAENPREISTVIDGESGGSTRRLFNSFPQRFEAPFAAELDHFINCMDGTTTPLVTKEESLCVADIIEKGVQSYREKRVVFF